MKALKRIDFIRGKSLFRSNIIKKVVFLLRCLYLTYFYFYPLNMIIKTVTLWLNLIDGIYIKAIVANDQSGIIY